LRQPVKDYRLVDDYRLYCSNDTTMTDVDQDVNFTPVSLCIAARAHIAAAAAAAALLLMIIAY